MAQPEDQLKISSLEEASVQELWDELSNRHTSAVLLTERLCEKSEESTEFYLKWSGSISTALGLVERGADRFRRICADAEHG